MFYSLDSILRGNNCSCRLQRLIIAIFCSNNVLCNIIGWYFLVDLLGKGLILNIGIAIRFQCPHICH